MKLKPSIRASKIDSKVSLIGVSGEKSWSSREIPLEIMIGDAPLARRETLKFVIVRSDSPYNMLLGRTTMQKIGIVVSTVHEAIKFHTAKGIETVFSTYESDKIKEGMKKVRETPPASTKGVLSCTKAEEKCTQSNGVSWRFLAKEETGTVLADVLRGPADYEHQQSETSESAAKVESQPETTTIEKDKVLTPQDEILVDEILKELVELKAVSTDEAYTVLVFVALITEMPSSSNHQQIHIPKMQTSKNWLPSILILLTNPRSTDGLYERLPEMISDNLSLKLTSLIVDNIKHKMPNLIKKSLNSNVSNLLNVLNKLETQGFLSKIMHSTIVVHDDLLSTIITAKNLTSNINKTSGNMAELVDLLTQYIYNNIPSSLPFNFDDEKDQSATHAPEIPASA
ncbi:hypothetical protein Tco_1113501 [Tanacetum coccineum]|uniref:Uncharacterized protein n=1 Tax=Tanacetum coccineum TaxID=301880 RepID=A0ABQ5IV33_9ASTR